MLGGLLEGRLKGAQLLMSDSDWVLASVSPSEESGR